MNATNRSINLKKNFLTLRDYLTKKLPKQIMKFRGTFVRVTNVKRFIGKN